MMIDKLFEEINCCLHEWKIQITLSNQSIVWLIK